MTTTASASSPESLNPSISVETSEIRPGLWRRLLWAIFLSLYFVAVYGFCNWFTHQRVLRGEHIPSLYFEWEKKIPLVASFIVPYMSIDLFFFASFLICTDLR